MAEAGYDARRVTIVCGTRPEGIKLAPLYREMGRRDGLVPLLCTTGQHTDMLDQVLRFFDVAPDVALEPPAPGSSLGALTAHLMKGLDAHMAQDRPDLVVVQGDTTTALCGALSAFYHRIPVAHVEAGLRTGDMSAPWPEEANRILVSRLAALHFAPTPRASENLVREGIPEAIVEVTGNTVIDALLAAAGRVSEAPPGIPMLSEEILGSEGRIVLVTGHRRESFGEGFVQICRALVELAARFPEATFVYPVHLNPNVRGPVNDLIAAAGNPRNILLIPPLEYPQLVRLLQRSHLVLTDSGGIQEEAPTFGKPVLVMRDATERQEAVEAGVAVLVGARTDRIVETATRLLRDGDAYAAMANASSPFGDGTASARIATRIERYLGL